MKRYTPQIPARRAAIAILILGFFFATAFYRCGTPSPPTAPPAPAPAPITTPVPAPEPAYDPDQGRDPTMESAETTTSYAGHRPARARR